MSGREDLSPWVAAVYVRPAYRRQGVGTKLMRHLESIARDVGVCRLYLFTPDMTPFYETLGWTVLEEAEFRGRPTSWLCWISSPGRLSLTWITLPCWLNNGR